MSLFRTIVAIIVVVLADLLLVLMPADLLLTHEAGIYSFVALIAFGAVAWAFVPDRRR